MDDRRVRLFPGVSEYLYPGRVAFGQKQQIKLIHPQPHTFSIEMCLYLIAHKDTDKYPLQTIILLTMHLYIIFQTGVADPEKVGQQTLTL